MTATHKRGDTFRRSGALTVTDYGTTVTDMTGWTGRSHIRDGAGNLIASLTFSWLDASQRLCELHAPAGTTGWPVGRASLDIELTTPAGEIVSTATQFINIIADVTV
jgi:hypothetical protein